MTQSFFCDYKTTDLAMIYFAQKNYFYTFLKCDYVISRQY